MDVQCGDHGTCIDGLDTYSCQCDPGYTGALCDKNYTTGKMLETILTVFLLKDPRVLFFYVSFILISAPGAVLLEIQVTLLF